MHDIAICILAVCIAILRGFLLHKNILVIEVLQRYAATLIRTYVTKIPMLYYVSDVCITTFSPH